MIKTCIQENITNKNYIKLAKSDFKQVTSHLGIVNGESYDKDLELIDGKQNLQDIKLNDLNSSLINSNHGDFIDYNLFPSI